MLAESLLPSLPSSVADLKRERELGGGGEGAGGGEGGDAPSKCIVSKTKLEVLCQEGPSTLNHSLH